MLKPKSLLLSGLNNTLKSFVPQNYNVNHVNSQFETFGHHAPLNHVNMLTNLIRHAF